MNYLLDTQVIIWSLDGDPRLPEPVREAIENSQNAVYITVVSLWEIAIKRSINKLILSANLHDIQHQIKAKQGDILPITVDHLETLESLPYQDGHKDPFDRLIISQAITENLILISSDPLFKKYPV